MKKEGKAGPFIPSQVRAHTGPRRATTLVVARKRRRATTAADAQAKASPLERRRVRPGDNACTQATTFAPVRRRVPRRRGVFSQTPQTSTLGRRHLCPGDNAYVRAATSALARRRPHPGFQTFAFFRALAIQTKLFHYLFFKITRTVLKMVIQSYFY